MQTLGCCRLACETFPEFLSFSPGPGSLCLPWKGSDSSSALAAVQGTVVGRMKSTLAALLFGFSDESIFSPENSSGSVMFSGCWRVLWLLGPAPEQNLKFCCLHSAA